MYFLTYLLTHAEAPHVLNGNALLLLCLFACSLQNTTLNLDTGPKILMEFFQRHILPYSTKKNKKNYNSPHKTTQYK